MSAVVFNCCAECGKKLRTSFFCQECGQPSCSLDCYCHHEARHADSRQPETTRGQDEHTADCLEQAR
jgi:hypothetical protein